MALWVDRPIWPAHGTVFAHLVSDTSLAELHAFAQVVGLHPRSYDGDHYDVPHRRWDEVVAAGALVVDGREITRMLVRTGLRFRKRKGERPLAALPDALSFLDVPHRLDIVASQLAPPDRTTVGAATFVFDRGDRVLLVHSVCRDTWEAPAGMREPPEPPSHTALRELREETGLVLEPGRLRPVGYERLTLRTPSSQQRWPHVDNHIAVYAAHLPQREPVVAPVLQDVSGAQWVPVAVARERSGALPWWPLLEHYVSSDAFAPGRG